MKSLLLVFLLISFATSEWIEQDLIRGVKAFSGALKAAKDFVKKNKDVKYANPVAIYSTNQNDQFKVIMSTQAKNMIHIEEIIVDKANKVTNNVSYDNEPAAKISSELYEQIQKKAEKYIKTKGLKMKSINNVVVRKGVFIVNVLVNEDAKKRTLVMIQNEKGNLSVMALFFME